MSSDLPLTSDSSALNGFIDHTLLSPIANETAVRRLCTEAWTHAFKAVCVPPTYVRYVTEMLEFCPIKIEIATVIGFPLGYSVTSAKLQEAESALKSGATELDVVMNLAQFKSMAYLSVQDELQQLSAMAHAGNALLKVIIETAYLDDFELQTACELCVEANADYVKTSTGFAPHGADPAIVKRMRELLPDSVAIKASGGIRDRTQALALLAAGASRLGTSAGPLLMEQP